MLFKKLTWNVKTRIENKDTGEVLLYLTKSYDADTHRRAGVATLSSDKGDFKARKIIRDKGVHYTVIKGIKS